MRRAPLATAIGLALFALGSIPYLVAARACPGAVFGGSLGDWSDTKQHLVWMRGYEHALLLPNVFSTEDTRPFLFNALFGAGGLLARALGDDVLAAWHVLRAIGCVAFVAAALDAVDRFVPRERRALASVLAIAPPILSLLKRIAPSLAFLRHSNALDANTLCYGFELPELAIAAALVVQAMVGIDEFASSRGARFPTRTAACVVALWLLHPYELAAVLVTCAIVVAGMAARRELDRAALARAGAAALVMVAPALLYVALDRASGGGYTATIRVFGEVALRPLGVVLSLGVACVVALLVAVRALPADGDAAKRRVLVAWLGGSFVAMVLPHAPFPWHQINGAQACVAMLAVHARFWRRVPQVAAAVVAGCLALALQGPYFAALARDATSCREPFFASTDLDGAYRFLAETTTARDHVMARPARGLDVALRSRARPFVADRGKTIDWPWKIPAADAFFDAKLAPGDARRLLDGAGIDLVLCDAASDAVCGDEAMRGFGFGVAYAVGATRVYRR